MAWNDLLSGTTVVGSSYFLVGGQGAALDSATSIAVTDSFHQVNGSTTVNTITGGVAGMGLFLYRPVGATWDLGSAGNIKASSSTATARVVLLVTPDGTTWYGDSQGVSVVSASNDIVVAESGGTYTLTFTPANISLDEFTGPLAITKGGTGQVTATAGFDALAPTTTTGDIIYYNGADNGRLAVGAAGTVMVGGTNPSYTATPLATTWGVGDVNNGMVSLGSNNVGWKINSANELDLNATRLAPVTNKGLALGDDDQFFLSAYTADDRGYRSKTLASGANTVANFPLAQGASCALMIVMGGVAAGTGSNTSVRQSIYQLAAYNAAGTISVNAVVMGTGAIVQTAVGTFNWNVFSAALADGAGETVDIIITATSGTGTVASVDFRYKLFWMYGDPVVTEV